MELEKDQTERYTGEDVQIKEGLEHVRTRPGMYIGSTDLDGLHHLVYEVLDNSIDEALGGYCSSISIKLLKDSYVEVEDNGRGIPVDIHPQTQTSTLEVVMTKLGAGGKFENKAYQVSGGLHGVGVSVVNALSEICEVYVKRNATLYYQKYCRGKVENPVIVVDSLEAKDLIKGVTGTKVRFKPDYQIFKDLNFEYPVLQKRIQELAFLNKGLTLSLEDLRDNDENNHVKELFYFEGGIASFVQFLNSYKISLHDRPIYVEAKKEGIWVEIALQYTESFQENIYSYVNNISTKDGGTHISGFKASLTRVINDLAKTFAYDKKMKGDNFEGEDVREGLTGILSIKHPNPQFEGQTKRKLGNSEVKGLVESILYENLKIYFEDNPNIIKKILDKVLLTFTARRIAQAKKEAVRKGYLDRDSLPGKLVDCIEKDPKMCELYIVEGESAGGTAKLGRSREIQAILPVQGKMLNVEKTRFDKVITNNKFQPIIASLGTGFGEHFNIQKLRYHKIIIMADADVDGSHIRTLLLTFFYRYFRSLIEMGHMYIAMPPLYRLQIAKKSYYAYDDAEKEKLLSSLNLSQNSQVDIQRYKGLGEMNPDQLWETTMNPENRMMMNVSIEDSMYAEQMFSILMGEKVDPRREFIEANAIKVKNVDV